MRMYRPKVPKSKPAIPPKGSCASTAAYIRAFDRLNSLKPVRYVSNDHN